MSIDLIHKQGRPSSLLACSVLVLKNYSPRLSFAALVAGEMNGETEWQVYSKLYQSLLHRISIKY